LKINDCESIIELVLEHALDIENAVAENEDSDSDSSLDSTGKLKLIAQIIYFPRVISESYANQDLYLPKESNLSNSYVGDILIPPPQMV